MPTDAYQNALARRAALQKEMSEIEQFLALYQKFSPANGTTTLPVKTNESSNLLVVPHGVRIRYRRSLKALKPQDVVSVVTSILEDKKRPMTRGEISKEIEERGLRLESKDNVRYLGTILWRNGKVFQNIEGKGYWFRDKPAIGASESDGPNGD